MGPSKQKRYRTISVKWAWQANVVGQAQQFMPRPGVAAVADEGDVVFSDRATGYRLDLKSGCPLG